MTMRISAGGLLAATLLIGCGSLELGGPPAAEPVEGRVETDEPIDETPWERARRLGYDFRAIGQEPGWFLELDFDGEMHLATNYAETHHYAATPEPVRDPSAGTTTYATRTGDLEITVVIADRACEDVMSGEGFPYTVTVRAGGEELSGCGRYLTESGRR